MGKRSFAKNYAFNLFYQTVIIALPLVTTPYLSRVLGAEEIGKYSFAHSIVSYFSLAAALGSTVYGQRLIAKESDREERTRLFFEVLLLRAMGVGAACLIYGFAVVPRSSSPLLYAVVALEILNVAFDISWFFQGAEDLKPVALCTAISKLFAVAGIFIFVKEPQDLIVYVIIYCGAYVLGSALPWVLLPRYLSLKDRRWRGLRIGRHFLPALSLFISQAAIQVYVVLDKTMIGVITGSDVENGYYEQSQKLARVLVAIVTSLGVVMASRVAVLWKENKKSEVYSLIFDSFRFVFALGMPIAVGVPIVADRFVPIFYGEGFEPVAPLISVLAVMVLIIGCSNVVGIQLLVPTEREKLLTVSVVAGAVVNLFLNLWLIRLWGSTGAAIASLAAELAVTGVQFFFVRREISVLKVLKILLRYLLYGGIMGAVGLGASRLASEGFWGFAIVVASCAVTYGGLLLVTRDKALNVFRRRKI